MTTIKDMLDEEIEKSEREEIPFELEEVEETLVRKPGLNIMELLLAETGEGEISDYIEHPLNFNRSEGLAQIIRGLTGMFGSLRYALIDIAVGYIRLLQEKKGAVKNEV